MGRTGVWLIGAQGSLASTGAVVGPGVGEISCIIGISVAGCGGAKVGQTGAGIVVAQPITTRASSTVPSAAPECPENRARRADKTRMRDLPMAVFTER